MRLGYLLDRYSFKLNSVLEITDDYELNIDEETNSKSIVKTIKFFDYKKGDYIFLYENNNLIFQGIITDVNYNSGLYEISLKYILNMFDRPIILENQDLIRNIGLEDFIFSTITNNYINSNDSLMNIGFIDIEVLTHNTFEFTPHNENGIYNLHTFLNNCSQNYNIQLDFEYVSSTNKLKITIRKNNISELFIDNTLSDIFNYIEKINLDFISKVTVISESGTKKSWFLRNDRSITDNVNDVNRIIGEETTIYVHNDEDMQQEAINVFSGNRYNHLIEFDMNSNTKIIDLTKLKVGNLIKIKSSKEIVESYISGITKKGNSNIINVKIGNLRINFLDKYLKGRY